jgi:hypothetical protein
MNETDNDNDKDEIMKIINQYLTPKKKQKDELGEVFTPPELIEDMLDKLPDSVWSDPTLTWLDPANGIGNFQILIFYRLNKGLEDWEKNEEKRRKHIIENMLYMTEIQSSNNTITKNIFDKLCGGAKPNIMTVNAIECNKKLFSIVDKLATDGWPDKYDFIIGNPPYNNKGTQKGGIAVWLIFIKLAFQLIKKNGFISYVHPGGWKKYYNCQQRQNQGIILNTVRNNNWWIRYINVSDKPPKHFPKVDFYVIQATDGSNKETIYESKFDSIRDKGSIIIDTPFIPNLINHESISIIKKLFLAKGNKIDIIINRSFQPTSSDSSTPGSKYYHYTSKDGTQKYIYGNDTTMPEYFTKSKIIMTHKSGYEKGRLYAFYSKEKIGTIENSVYMFCDNDTLGEKYAAFFNSNIITFLMKITQYSASPIHANDFKILNQLEMPASLEEYNFTEKEINLISYICR